MKLFTRRVHIWNETHTSRIWDEDSSETCTVAGEMREFFSGEVEAINRSEDYLEQ